MRGFICSGILAGFCLCSCVCVKALQASLLDLSLSSENSGQTALHCQSCLCSVLPEQTGGAVTKQHYLISEFPGKQKGQVQNISHTSPCRQLGSHAEVVCLVCPQSMSFWRGQLLHFSTALIWSEWGTSLDGGEHLQHPCAVLQLQWHFR